MSDQSTDIESVDEVWLGDQSVAGEEFVAALEAVEEFQHVLRDIKADLDTMEIGLDQDDAARLIYARNHELALAQVEASFEIINAFVEEDIDDVAPRIIADQTVNLTIAEAAMVWDDMVDLGQKYGSLKGHTEDNE